LSQNESKEVELIENKSFCERLAYSFTVKTSMKDSEVAKINQALQNDTEGEKDKVCGCISADNWEIFVTFCLVSFELFQVLMACLLAMFVPQQCYLVAGGSRTCTTDDIFSPVGIKNSDLSGRVLTLNFVTLVVSLLHYLYMYRREKALVQLLQAAPGTASDRLPEILPFYPEVRNMLYGHHFRVLCSATLLSALFLANGVLTAILVFAYRYSPLSYLLPFCPLQFLYLLSLSFVFTIGSLIHPA
jgi:hypothetical protein